MPPEYTRVLEQFNAAVDAIRAIPALLTVLIVLLGLSILTTAVVGGIIAAQLGRLVRSTTGRIPAQPPQQQLPHLPSSTYPAQPAPGVEYGPYPPRGP